MQEKDFDLLFQQIKSLILNKPVLVDMEQEDEHLRLLQEAIGYLANCLSESNEFLRNLSMGNLNIQAPSRHNFLAGNLKELHAGLRHLTWQAGQVANGDYKQKVNFLGEFSDSFNAMIRQLDERETKLTAQADELAQSIGLMVSILDKIKEWVLTIDQESGEIIYVNRSAREEYYDARTNRFLCQNKCDDACALMEKLRRMQRDLTAEEKQFNFSCTYCNRILRVESNRILWNDKYAYVHFLEDITSEVDEREELKNLAYQDELTGLYNRRYCMNLLEELIDNRKLFSVCVADLDRLKLVNDQYGHLKGDEYISTVADEMIRLTSENEGVVCRVGGDEFILLLPGFSQEQAQLLLEQLADNINQAQKSKEFPMSVSFGVVDVLPRTATALERILQEADERMYVMKEKSRNP